MSDILAQVLGFGAVALAVLGVSSAGALWTALLNRRYADQWDAEIELAVIDALALANTADIDSEWSEWDAS